MPRGPRKTPAATTAAPCDPRALRIERAIAAWLEGAVLGNVALEDLEIVPAHDPGAPGRDHVAVHAALAPGAGPRRVEIILDLHGDHDDVVSRDLHALMALPLDPEAGPADPDSAEYSDVLTDLAEQHGITLPALGSIRHATLPHHATGDRLIYAGTLIP